MRLCSNALNKLAPLKHQETDLALSKGCIVSVFPFDLLQALKNRLRVDGAHIHGIARIDRPTKRRIEISACSRPDDRADVMLQIWSDRAEGVVNGDEHILAQLVWCVHLIDV